MKLSRLRGSARWILQQRNRRVMLLAVLGNMAVDLCLLFRRWMPLSCALCGLLTIFLVAVLTSQRSLILATAGIVSLQTITLMLINQELGGRAPFWLFLLLLPYSAWLVWMLLSMLDSVQQQQYHFSLRENREKRFQEVMVQLLTARGMSSIYQTLLFSVRQLYGRSCILFTPGPDGRLQKEQTLPAGLLFFPAEYEAAALAREREQWVGRFTDLCSYTAFLHIPLRAEGNVIAVLAVLFRDGEQEDVMDWDEFSKLLLRAEAALERQILEDRQQQAKLEIDRERIRSDFMRSISHDFRSPLTGIVSACSTLQQAGSRIDFENQNRLLSYVQEEAESLVNMVENLLSITRVGQSVYQLKKSPEFAEEVLGEVVRRCLKRFPEIRLDAVTPEEPLLVPMDATLIIQVLINLVENAAKYSGSKRIDLLAGRAGAQARFTVRDYGVGIPPELQEKLFTPLELQDTGQSHGLGIGLSICRSIIRAHGGQIAGYNSPEYGAVFTFTLPLEECNP